MRHNTQAWIGAEADRNNFLPASRYYGDKYARTMEEAFGPGAQLDVENIENEPAVCLLVGAVIVAAIVIVVGWFCMLAARS